VLKKKIADNIQGLENILDSNICLLAIPPVIFGYSNKIQDDLVESWSPKDGYEKFTSACCLLFGYSAFWIFQINLQMLQKDRETNA